MVGKFLCCRKYSPMTRGLIYKVTEKRIYFVESSEENRWISTDEFSTRQDLSGNNTGDWYWIQDKPTGTLGDNIYWKQEKIDRLKKEKNI